MAKLLVGVSGGPDSMMLLDKLVKEGNEIVAAHVNYQLRSTAFRDEAIVKDYCALHNIILERCYPGLSAGNFQRVAREARYRFFAQMAKKHDCEAVAIAHHLNDAVETYILQKERQSFVSCYGLAPQVTIQGVKVIRPLLAYAKSEILAYCEENKIPYGIDESNTSNKYRRNVIRQAITETELERNRQDLVADNKILERFKAGIDRKKAFGEQTAFVQRYLVYEVLNEAGYHYFTGRHVETISEVLIKQGHYRYREEFILELNENVLKLTKTIDCDYTYLLSELLYQSYPQFEITIAGPQQNGVEVRAEDWPLTIRNWQTGDRIEMPYGTKKISRFFIDRKISPARRRSWPVVLNRDNKIILVPGLGTDRTHFSQKANLYVIK